MGAHDVRVRLIGRGAVSPFAAAVNALPVTTKANTSTPTVFAAATIVSIAAETVSR